MRQLAVPDTPKAMNAWLGEQCADWRWSGSIEDSSLRASGRKSLATGFLRGEPCWIKFARLDRSIYPDLDGLRLANQLGIRTPSVLWSHREPGLKCLITGHATGVQVTEITSPRLREEVWSSVARMVSQMHRYTAQGVGYYDRRGLLVKSYESYGHFLSRSRFTHPVNTVGLPDRLQRRIDAATRLIASSAPPDSPPTLVHGDLAGYNVLMSPREPLKPVILDFEFSMFAPAVADLAGVLEHLPGGPTAAEGFLEAYTADGNRSEVARWLEPLGTFWHVYVSQAMVRISHAAAIGNEDLERRGWEAIELAPAFHGDREIG